MMKLDMLKSNELARSLGKSIARGEQCKLQQEGSFLAIVKLVFSYGNDIVYLYTALLKARASLSAFPRQIFRLFIFEKCVLLSLGGFFYYSDF